MTSLLLLSEKTKPISQDKKTAALKSTQSSVKKRRKRKGNKELLNNISKNDSKKVIATNEVAKRTSVSMQNSKRKRKRSKSKFAAEHTKRPNVPTKHPKDDNKTTKISQKIQTDTDSKIKCKKRNRKRKQSMNSDHMNNDTARDTSRPRKYPRNDSKITKVFQKVQTNTDNETKRKKKNKRQKQNINSDNTNNDTAETNVIKRNKKLQNAAKNTISFERSKTKIQNIKKVNEKKMKQISTKPKTQQIKPEKILKVNKYKIKIKRLEEMLNKSPKQQTVQPVTLRDRMMAQLRASRFRYINETLYNNESSQSKQYFKEDPDAFKAYHDGYKQQLEQWPINPLDIIISSIKKMPKDNIIADFGCGEARLADSVPHKVHSFDLVALNYKVKACDMAHTPLLTNSVHVVVFCLSLMGSNLNDYIMEANRVLKNNGTLKIAEIESRFKSMKNFIKLLEKHGFKNTWKDFSHDLFYFMDFKKEENINMKRKNLPPITLKSCLYKKR